jgi:hypothetical protein
MTPPAKPSLLDRQGLLLFVAGICVLNGIFSPYLVIALQIAPVLMPELFPRTVGWALFFSSLVVSTATLLASGVPAAIYERLIETDDEATTSMWIWIGGAMLMSLPALENFHGSF